MAGSFRLGYVAEPLEGHEAFQGFISIPYLRPSGVIALKFRRADDEGKPKYLSLPGFGTHLYNAGALRGVGRAVGLTEGEFDAITLHGLCGLPAVGIPGVSQWRGHQAWWELFEGRQVLMFPDVDRKKEGEDPGETLAKEVVESLDSVRVVRLPEPEGDECKMDVNSFYLKHGKEALRKLAGIS